MSVLLPVPHIFPTVPIEFWNFAFKIATSPTFPEKRSLLIKNP